MKPNFEKIANRILSDEEIGFLKADIKDALESAYLEGRKAQIEIDAEIAKIKGHKKFYDDDGKVYFAQVSIAKAIKEQGL